MESAPMERRRTVSLPQEEFEAMLERAAERGARHALSEVGLDGPEAAQSRLHKHILSLQIDLRLSREEEFTAWLNSLYFGNHAYGIEAAGRVYFGRSVSELSLAEAAMLAALPFAPATYNPAVNPESVRNRRKWVLLTMRDHGFITSEECLFASLMPVVPPTPPARIAPAPLLLH